ncbi:sulfatase [Rhodopirellula sp. MGV]|uniref:sulfatase family protein n=1 Tax=Rhodopirellula sp. MGV TaxID=2023130 RepID=UPI000B95DC9F|nr:sulfatase [Rhodopirellula sp. MGV]OYP31713.1 heparan N-sulfatase [Rhodopirellula sp. MGV]PNY34013.1 heparan N-sulfatase [Rhodopirellula baltica]
MRFLTSAALLFLSVCTAVANERPNIVVYLADDLSQRDISVYDEHGIKTPALEALASEGMTFNQAFVASPSCAPSRAALLTGLMPARNGAEENHSTPSADVDRLPFVLKDLGYQVASFGKIAHSNRAKSFGFEVVENAKEMPKLLQNVTRFLNNRKDDRPLALFVGIGNPHVPWPNHSSFDPAGVYLPPMLIDTPRTRVQRSRYLQEVKQLDEVLASLRTLTQKHLQGDPIYVFSSDHGAQFPLGKWTLYEEGIRVPLIVSWPGHIQANTRTDAMVSWVDMLPTLIELAGGEVPTGLDGASFADVLSGKAKTHRALIFTTHSGDRQMNVYPVRSVRDGRFKYIRNLHPEFAFTTHIDLLHRANSSDYILEWQELAKTDATAADAMNRYHARPAEELYDLESDPYERNNLIDETAHAANRQQLSDALDAWLKDQGDEMTVFHQPYMLDEPETWVPRSGNSPE